MDEHISSPLPPSPSELAFFEVTQPSVPRGKAAQRLIRSHVTRLQHRKRRESCREGNADTASLQPPSAREISAGIRRRIIPAKHQILSALSEATPSTSDDTISTDSGLAFLNTHNSSQIKTPETQKLVRSHVTKLQHRKRRMQTVELSEELSPRSDRSVKQRGQHPLPILPESPSEKLIAKGAAAIRNVILQDSSNTVASCLNRLGFDLKSVMSHYYYMAVQVHAPEFEDFYKLPGICATIFLPFLFTDPALTSAIVLIALIHQMSLAGIKETPPEIFRFKGFVISAINGALEDQRRARSNQLIFAVANLAIFEAVFGNKDVYHVHWRGLMNMMRVRSGFPDLRHDGYLEKVLRWYDTNCAHVVGCKPYLERPDHSALADGKYGMSPDVNNSTVGLASR